MERLLSFSAKTAADVMTPRTRVRTVSASSPVATVIEATRDSGRSRFPVIGDSVDDIRGVIHVKVAALIGESSEEGLLKSDQHELITGALAFEETKAEAVGLPLDTLVTVDPDVTPGRVEQLVGQSRVA